MKPMFQVQQHLIEKKLNVTALHYNLARLRKLGYQKKLKNSDVVLIDTVKAYHSALSYLNKLNCTLIVFDSPIMLQHHEGMHILDINPSPDLLKYNFTNKPLDYAIIQAAVKQKKIYTENLTRNRTDLLEEVIKIYTVSGFLDKFNTYLYDSTTPLHRNAVKGLLVQFIFGNTTLEKLVKDLETYIKDTPKHRQLLAAVTDYMITPPGQQLQKALQYAQKMENEAKKNSRRAIAYKKIGEMFGVDHFELRNIILLYRNLK